ncbi:hypothetical protein J4208_03515 [Candidatus Woesearchaeota archaeon]|nr:hypothetical protein [Candidatus Woesearchaeota archaeon]
MASDTRTKLEKWLNPIYLQEETMQALKKAFTEQDIPHIQLQDFFTPEKAKTILQHFQRAHYQQQYVPDKYNYAVADQLGSLATVQEVFQDPLMSLWLEEITGKKSTASQVSILRFTHGDYTLMHDSETPEEGILLVYDPVTPWSVEAGGYEVFTLPEKDPLVIQPQQNTLTIVCITKETRNFTKYVNSLCGDRKRYCLQGNYLSKK